MPVLKAVPVEHPLSNDDAVQVVMLLRVSARVDSHADTDSNDARKDCSTNLQLPIHSSEQVLTAPSKGLL